MIGKLRAARWGNHWLFALLLALLVIRLWLPPLNSSFWGDETATMFVAQHGSHDPSLQGVAFQVWQSWYYTLIHFWGKLFGFSEESVRIPSLLATLVLLFLIARLSMRLIHPESGWFAVFACLAFPGINYQAANARPYAVGICLFAGGMLFLVRWLDSAKWLDACLFLGCAASVVYVHMLLGASCLVYVLYAVIRIAFEPTPVSWRRAMLVFGLLGVLALPAFLQILQMLPDVQAHVYVPLPHAAGLLHALGLSRIVLCGGAAWLIARTLKWLPGAGYFSVSSMVLIAGWWIWQPAFLFGFSRLTDESLFVERYFQIALLGAALAATFAASRFIPTGKWRPLAGVLGIAVLAYLGNWRQLRPQTDSGWRAAAAAINQIEGAKETPVICLSPFVEARPPLWRASYRLPSLLYAPLDSYPVQGRIYPFPYEASSEAEAFASNLSSGPLAASRHFLIYGRKTKVQFWRNWFMRRDEFAGWRHRELGPFQGIDYVIVCEFEAPARETTGVPVIVTVTTAARDIPASEATPRHLNK